MRRMGINALRLSATVLAFCLTSWGGYSGYFADPDGYLWEVAYADQWKFNPDGSVIVE